MMHKAMMQAEMTPAETAALLDATATAPYRDDKLSSAPALTCMLCEKHGASLYTELSDWLFSAPGNWGVRQCAACQIAWLDPEPAADTIPKLYAQYYTHSTSESPVSFKSIRDEISQCVLNRLGYRVERPTRLLPRLLAHIPPIARAFQLEVFDLPAGNGGTLLDVGSGDGMFIARMRALGWRTSGVDPDPEAVAFAQSQELEVFQGTVADVPLEATFDVITLSHVIEHVADPIGLLRECRRRLRPGGRLFITTPNIQSLGHRWFGKYWRGLEIPRHLTLFSLHSLAQCLFRAGLRPNVLRTETRMAVRIHNASACAKNGEENVSQRRTFGATTKITGYVFMLVENTLIYLRRNLGEEIFCECSAA